MGFITGKNAAINGVSCARRWRLDSRVFAVNGMCSAAGGGEFIVAGNKDWNGVISAYGVEPAAIPGAAFSLAADIGNAKSFDGTAIVSRVEVFAKVEEAALLYHYLHFESNGALTRGTTDVTDAGTPGRTSAKGLGVKVGGTTKNVRSWHLDVQCLNAVFNDTSTDGATERAEGNFRALWDYEAYFDDPSDLPTEGSFYTLLFQTTADSDTGWQVDYGYVESVVPDANVEGDGEGRAVGIWAKVSGTWSSYTGSGQGTIVTPASTIVYP